MARSRSPLLLGAALAAAGLVPGGEAPAAISAKTVRAERHPGGIVTRQERVTIGGRTSDVTTVTMPTPGRGRALEPYLPKGRVSSGTTTTSGITRALARFGTAVSIDGRLLNRPSDGHERRVGNVLVCFRPDRDDRTPIRAVRVSRVAPGERVPRLSFALRGRVRVELSLRAPDGAWHVIADRRFARGRHVVRVPKRIARPGRWQLEVAAPDDQDRVRKRFTVRRRPRPAPAADEAATPVADARGTVEPAAADDEDGGSGVGWLAAGVAIVVLAGSAMALVGRRRR